MGKGGAGGVGSLSISCSLKETYKARMNDLVRQQTDEWTKLKTDQMNEVHQLVLTFMDARKDLLLKVC